MLKASSEYFIEITGFTEKYSDLVLKLNCQQGASTESLTVAQASVLGVKEIPPDPLASVSAQLDRITDLLQGHQPVAAELDGEPKVVIAEAELERTLQVWREEVAQRFSGPSWPGPAANIFQRSIISDIMTWQPTSVEEVLRLPDVAWRYEKNKPLMKAQLDSYRDQLNQFLACVWKYR